MTTVTGQLEILADDGDIQVEPMTVTDSATATLVTFTNTAQTFFVNRKPGKIVDIVVPACSTATTIKFKVNGKDTGVQKLLSGLIPTVNNRMPAAYPIAGGAAVQATVQ
jgi:hypothetical protein